MRIGKIPCKEAPQHIPVLSRFSSMDLVASLHGIFPVLIQHEYIYLSFKALSKALPKVVFIGSCRGLFLSAPLGSEGPGLPVSFKRMLS